MKRSHEDILAKSGGATNVLSTGMLDLCMEILLSSLDEQELFVIAACNCSVFLVRYCVYFELLLGDFFFL